jgi:hypothetical protein
VKDTQSDGRPVGPPLAVEASDTEGKVGPATSAHSTSSKYVPFTPRPTTSSFPSRTKVTGPEYKMASS